jgi:GTP pyrophosphokinase
MVKVRDSYPQTQDGALDIEAWIDRINLNRDEHAHKQICRACEMCLFSGTDVLTPEGNSAFEQGLAMAEILSNLSLDTDTILASILYSFVKAKAIKIQMVAEKISDTVEGLIAGSLKMDAIRSLHQRSQSDALSATQVEKLRKMLLAMVDDPRVILIKLAAQVCTLREVKNASDELRRSVAKETADIYAPLANRLGIGQLKWELEDLSFRYLHTAEYKKIALKLKERRVDRDNYVGRVLERIEKEMNNLGVEAKVTGRAKHIYSIWKKMTRKNVGFEEIYDVRAVRVIVDSVSQCYMALGAVHGLWQHIPKEFDDYIATPKGNGYRSLHTAVIGPEKKHLEVQIRTQQMHDEAELGVAAHWLYKEGGEEPQATSGFDGKINWLRNLLEWQEGIAEGGELLEDFKNQIVEDRVYVFTPQGAVVDLPYGATAVDFAYHVHTEIGHRCRGAKTNGRIIPLTQALETGQTVEILTIKSGKPSRDWLNPHQGYVKSTRARSKIHHWFKQQDKDQNIAEGRLILATELSREGLTTDCLKTLATYFNYHNELELFAAIGAGDIGVHTAVNAAHKLYAKPKSVESETSESISQTVKKPKHSDDVSDITIGGVGDLMTKMAGCCHPIIGDGIIGYVSQGRGVIIHRQDCKNVDIGKKESPERFIEVDWGRESENLYAVDIAIHAYDRKSLLKDITNLLANEKVNVTSFNTAINRKNHTTDIMVQIEVSDNDTLELVMNKLQNISNVKGVKRR